MNPTQADEAKAVKRLLDFTAEWKKRSMVGDNIYALGLADGEYTLTASDIERVCTQLAEAQKQLAALQDVIAPVGNYGDPEGTANPYWLIIDPHQMFKPDCHTVANMVTGPFFSREAAQQHLTARRYAFGKHAAVYCHSAYWSKQYRALQEATSQPTQDKGDE